MTPEEFRKHAHQMVDWMADFLENVDQYPVRAQVKPGEIAAKLPLTPPEEGEAMGDIFDDFKTDVMPGMTHWQHPNWFAYFPANSSPPSILAEMLTSTLGAQCMVWETSPAATEMETRVLDWLRQMIGLPEGFAGVIQDSASSAILCAILTAREKKTGWKANTDGLKSAPQLAVYTSEQTHSSTEKNTKISGIGLAGFRKIGTDDQFRMRPDLLEEAIKADIENGLVPACVVASVGGTGVGAVDPLREIGEICQKHDIFLHVDAAWAGSALICPENRWMIDGIEYADSLVFNPHKWLLTNFDCSAHFVKDPDALVRTFSILPEYLKTSAGSQVIDYRDWGVQLGRRFRALKLWFVIRSYGVKGLQDILRNHIAMTANLSDEIDRSSDFELMAPTSLALINFRFHPIGIDDQETLNKLNSELLTRINDDGTIYLTRNVISGCDAIRISVGQTTTAQANVDICWSTIQSIAKEVMQDFRGAT